MSTLKVDTIQNTSDAHSSTPEQIAQGRAKAWVEFNGTGSHSIIGSYNVSSVSRTANGNYTVNFTSSFANTNLKFLYSRRIFNLEYFIFTS